MIYTGKTYTGYLHPNNMDPNDVAVFGSNCEGRHGKGTALICRQQFGAINGKAHGLQGKSWGFITTDLRVRRRPSVDSKIVKQEVKKLYDYALQHPELNFKGMYTGLTNNNLSGFTNDQFANFFSKYPIPANIIFEEQFATLLTPIACNVTEAELEDEYDPLDDPKWLNEVATKAFSEAAIQTMEVMGYNVVAKDGFVVKVYKDGHIEKIKKI